MTREELFSQFPRPWQAGDSEYTSGAIRDKDGNLILLVDPWDELEVDDVSAIADLICELVNGAEE